jgi:tetratricopeptide (TPR) repeat protein
MKKVEALMMRAQQDVIAHRVDKAVASLKAGMKYGSWQFYVKQQINSQIGSILYMKRDFNDALPYLEKGFVRNWVSMAMLGISYMKKNKTKKMQETFDKAISGAAKEPMIYALYAFCLDRIGERLKGIAILEKGLKKTANDERLKENIALLQAGKKMKMKGFGDMWYQFHLEKQGVLIKKQTKALTGRRKQVLR